MTLPGLHRFDLATQPVTPWRNGGGTTQVLASGAAPGAAPDAFDWRVSVARIAADGPFSRYPGVDRVIMLLDGSGVRLCGDGIDHRLDVPLAPWAFAGEAAITATCLVSAEGGSGAGPLPNPPPLGEGAGRVTLNRRGTPATPELLPPAGGGREGGLATPRSPVVPTPGQEELRTSLDFNVMTRRAVLRAAVSVLRDTTTLPACSHGLLLAVAGSWALRGHTAMDTAVDLAAGTGVWWQGPRHGWQARATSASDRAALIFVHWEPVSP